MSTGTAIAASAIVLVCLPVVIAATYLLLLAVGVWAIWVFAWCCATFDAIERRILDKFWEMEI